MNLFTYLVWDEEQVQYKCMLRTHHSLKWVLYSRKFSWEKILKHYFMYFYKWENKASSRNEK